MHRTAGSARVSRLSVSYDYVSNELNHNKIKKDDSLDRTATQQTFTYSKSTIETLGKGMEYVQSSQKRHQTDANDLFLVFQLLILNR